MTDVSKNYDLVTGRDTHGELWYTQVPPAKAERGNFIRLVGGIFILTEGVEHMGRIPRGSRYGSAAEVLRSVWGGSGT